MSDNTPIPVSTSWGYAVEYRVKLEHRMSDSQHYLDDYGPPHRLDGPAIISYHDRFRRKVKRHEYRINGLYDRVDISDCLNDLPTIITYNLDGSISSERWHSKGELHRKYQPAIIKYNESGEPMSMEWWLNGQRHREFDLPAVAKFNTELNIELKTEWWLNGKLSRDYGKPSIIEKYNDGTVRSMHWYIDGQVIPGILTDVTSIHYHPNGNLDREYIAPVYDADDTCIFETRNYRIDGTLRKIDWYSEETRFKLVRRHYFGENPEIDRYGSRESTRSNVTVSYFD